MKTKINVLTLISALLVSGCGGGGGGTESAPVANPSSTTASSPATPVTSPTPTPSPGSDSETNTGAQSLIIDANFNLTSEIELMLDIKLEDIQQNSYLTICSYDKVTEQTKHQECIYKGPITEKGINEKILLSHRKTILAAEVWRFEEGYQPVQYLWEYEVSKALQRFVVR